MPTSLPGSSATRPPMRAIRHGSIEHCANTCRDKQTELGDPEHSSHRHAAFFACRREDPGGFLWPTAAKSHCFVQNRKLARPTRFERVASIFGRVAHYPADLRVHLCCVRGLVAGVT